MTPRIIELKRAPVVLVELPEGFKSLEIETDQSKIPYGQDLYYEIPGRDRSLGHDETDWVPLPDGNWRISGILSDLTEEQFAECVKVFNQINGDIVYANYTMGTTDEYLAKDSFYSLLESEKVYTENPYRHPDEIYTNRDDSNIFQKHSMKKWQEAQQRTIDAKRTVLLLKK